MKNYWKAVSCGIIVLILASQESQAVPQLKLPFVYGEGWYCTQGNYNDPQGSSNITHKKDSGMDYAWDFGYPGSSLGRIVVSPAAGTIIYVGYSSGFGNAVIIDYGDGSYGKLAHMLNDGEHPMLVAINNRVAQGQPIGYCGDTGYNVGGAHIHYQTQSSMGVSIQSSFVDVVNNSGIPIEDLQYTSHNPSVGVYSDGTLNQPILTAYNNISGNKGIPASNKGGPIYVHDWYGVTIQDFAESGYGDDGRYAIIYNPNLTPPAAYPLVWGFWGIYKNHKNIKT